MGGIRLREATRWLLLFAAAAFAPAGSCSEYVGEPELRCQEAAQKIVDCCGRVIGMNCSDHGCGIRPLSLSEPSSLCIRNLSCDALVQAGACAIMDWTDYDNACNATMSACGTDAGPECEKLRADLCQVRGKLTCP